MSSESAGCVFFAVASGFVGLVVWLVRLASVMIRLRRRAAAVLCAALAVACSRRAQAPRTLTAAIPAFPATLVPNRVPEELSLSVQKNLYESLTNLDAGLGVTPGLASSWKTPDDRTWVFSIPDGVEFHDGRRLDAKVAADCLRATLADPKTAPPLWNVAEISARGPHTLVVTTRSPYPTLAQRLAWVLICLPARDAKALPVGTGPYVMERFDAKAGTISLRAFERYRGGAPAIPRLELRVIGDATTRAQAVSRRAVNLAMDVPVASLAQIRRDPRLSTATRIGLRVMVLGTNGAADRRFADPRARRAVALAVDRESLVRGPLSGFASPSTQIVAPGVFGFSRDVPVPARDLAEAKRLLAESGKGRGAPVQIDYVLGKYVAMEDVARELARQLHDVGIEAVPRASKFPEFLERLRARDFDLALFGWLTLSDAASSYNYLLHTPSTHSGSSNYFGFSDPAVDRAIDEALLEPGAANRQDLLDSVMRAVAQQAPVVPLYTQWDIYAFDRNLQFVPRLDRFLLGAQMSWAPE